MKSVQELMRDLDKRRGSLEDHPHLQTEQNHTLTIRQQWGLHAISKKPVKVDQYEILLDGRVIGYLGWKSSRIMLLEKFGPLELQAITDGVSQLLGKPITSTTAPDLPEHLQAPESFEAGDI